MNADLDKLPESHLAETEMTNEKWQMENEMDILDVKLTVSYTKSLL